MLNAFHFNNNKLVDYIDILFNINIVFKVEMNQQIEFVETFKTENQTLQNLIKFANMLKIFDMNSFFTIIFRHFVIVNDSFKFDDIKKIYLEKFIYLLNYKLFQNHDHFYDDFEIKTQFNRLQYSFNRINETIVQQTLS